MAAREFEVVLFGASGFVGALTAAELAASDGPGTRVALAGRDHARLEAVRNRLGEPARGWAILQADAADAAALHRLAARTAVLATTVGPYIRHGREVLRAAAEEGTHYADLTGEVLFVRWSLDEVDAAATASGAKIVHSCGFDSVPSDLGVLLTAERAAEDGEGTLAETTLIVRRLAGGLSGGTIDSGRQQAILVAGDPAARRVVRDPDSLNRLWSPPPATARGRGARWRHRVPPVEREPGTGHWLGPFVMGDYNSRIVRLSNALADAAYGREFGYRELVDYGAGPAASVMAVATGVGLGAVQAALSWTPTRRLLDRVLPAPGEGPSPAQRAAGRFRMEIVATTTTGARYRTTVAADLDPGYGATAVMLAQSALALARDGDRLPRRAGVLTPATALGGVLADRLRRQGFTFDVRRA